MKKHFKPEFLNRLTDFVIFQPLGTEALGSIIDIELRKLQTRLAKKQITIEISLDAKNFLIKKGHQPEMGARPLNRALEQLVEDPLSEMLLRRPDQKWGCTIELDGEKLLFHEKPSEQPAESTAASKVEPPAPAVEEILPVSNGGPET